MSNIFQVFIRSDESEEWRKPNFPKVSRCIDRLREDAKYLPSAYDHVAIFKDGELIEKIEKNY